MVTWLPSAMVSTALVSSSSPMTAIRPSTVSPSKGCPRKGRPDTSYRKEMGETYSCFTGSSYPAMFRGCSVVRVRPGSSSGMVSFTVQLSSRKSARVWNSQSFSSSRPHQPSFSGVSFSLIPSRSPLATSRWMCSSMEIRPWARSLLSGRYSPPMPPPQPWLVRSRLVGSTRKSMR